LKPTADCKKHEGLKREFYPAFDFQGKAIASVDGQINFDWGPTVNDPSISNAFKDSGIEAELGLSKDALRQFSLKWTGFICPDVAGEYEIHLETGGIEKGGKATMRFQGKSVDGAFTASLEPGTAYEICVEFPRLESTNPQQSAKPGAKPAKKAGMVKQFLRTLARHRRRRRQLAGMPSSVSLQWRMPPAAGDPTFPREVAAAKDADAVIACLGLGLGYEREGLDKKSLEMPPEQDELMKRLVAANPNTIAVMVTGSPLSFPWIAERVPAILLAWYPGERGGDAIADILSGDVNPSGHLPMTFYRSTGQLPPFNEYDLAKGKTYWYFEGEPLYPFGFGLSYTAFEFEDLRVDKDTYGANDTIAVRVRVKNVGDRTGAEVVQVYTRYASARGAARANDRMPFRQLKGFSRVQLRPGEQKDVAIDIPVQRLELYDEPTSKFVVLAGQVEIMIGTSSRDIKLSRTITIE
jgi:hypothetical protein